MHAHDDSDASRRASIVDASRALVAHDLNVVIEGNVSVRDEDGFLITPTGVTPERLEADMIVPLDADGAVRSGSWKPSSEWMMHAAAYAVRDDAGAIVHTHSTHATALACLGQGIPPFHYMVAVGGGDTIPCTPYATFGSAALAELAAEALRDRNACLLGNHGVLALAADIDGALVLARYVEELARQYLAALSAGTPRLLDAGEMALVLEKFTTYGKQDD
ncbi:MAG: class II aldolase [Gammaproteobacteria bacterium]|nr:class II aldolase/adducin family protein [Gammaproteobacteria bacterium]NNL99537.1 class II aldolase [Gammaproteobacteria bacterium]